MNLTAHLPAPVRLPALAARHNKRVVYETAAADAAATLALPLTLTKRGAIVYAAKAAAK